MVITIIGNKTNSNNDRIADGGRIRVSLYERLLIEEGFDVRFIDLEGWRSKFFSIIKNVKTAVKKSDIILIMGGPNGARILLTLCTFFNRNKKTRIVYSILGVGTIHQKIKFLTPEAAQSFLKGENTYNVRDEKMGKKLSKIDLVLAQNNVIANFYKTFYKLDNVEVMENFRYFLDRPSFDKAIITNKDKIYFVYYSRINDRKGIFDILEAFKKIQESESLKSKWSLEIIGDIQLNDEELVRFNSSLNEKIKYKGIISNNEALTVLNKYDFLVFPTKYHGEGTPGVIIESFLAGTPVLVSRYSQATELINDGENGLIFELNNVDSLKEKIEYIMSLSLEEINNFKKHAYESGEKFTYHYNRKRFLTYITGKEIE